jgi:hypothetical protein
LHFASQQLGRKRYRRSLGTTLQLALSLAPKDWTQVTSVIKFFSGYFVRFCFWAAKWVLLENPSLWTLVNRSPILASFVWEMLAFWLDPLY